MTKETAKFVRTRTGCEGEDLGVENYFIKTIHKGGRSVTVYSENAPNKTFKRTIQRCGTMRYIDITQYGTYAVLKENN